MATFRVGVTGIGYMGQLEARVCGEMPGFEVVALHNRSPEKASALAQELGCAAYETLDEMLERERLDALIVATPNNAHLEPVAAAAAHGVNVFLEKPMGLHVAECREMIRVAESAGVVLFMGHPQRFMDGVRRARQAVVDGLVGRPVALRVERVFWVDVDHQAPGWKTRRSLSGGHLFHHIHEIDTARWILGDVDSVFAQMGNLAHEAGGPEAEDDVVQVAVRYSRGTLGTFEFGSAYRNRSHFLRIDGSEGTVVVNWSAGEGGQVAITAGKDTQLYPMYDDPDCRQSAADVYAAMAKGIVHGSDKWGAPLFLRKLVEREFECFHRVLDTGEIEPDLRGLLAVDGLRSVEIAQAACISAAERRVVDLPLP